MIARRGLRIMGIIPALSLPSSEGLATNGDRFWAKALHSRLKSHIERGPLRFFEISAFLSILAGARRAPKRGRDGHTDSREIHALRGSKREKGALARGGRAARAGRGRAG